LRDEVVREVQPALPDAVPAPSSLLVADRVRERREFAAHQRAEARSARSASAARSARNLPRLARAFATEGVLLSLLGAGVGVLLANAALATIAATGVVAIPLAADAGVDGRVLLFAVATGLATGVLFGPRAARARSRGANLHDVIRTARPRRRPARIVSACAMR
jgi:hypothetical protein